MPKVDPRRVFQTVNLVDGVMCAAAMTHLMPLAPNLIWVGLTQVALAGACLCPRCQFVGPVVTRAKTTRPYIALSFDDGPDPALTPWILKTLKQYGARASFFCIGTRARTHRQDVLAIARAGHSIENHSDHHSYRFAFLGSRALAREIDGAQRTLENLCGQAPRFFRAPFGFRNPWLAPLLEERRLHCAAWSRRGFDTWAHDAARVQKRLTRSLRAGDILLLHDGQSGRDHQNRPIIYTVLPQLLREIQDRGLTAVDLPTLLNLPSEATGSGLR